MIANGVFIITISNCGTILALYIHGGASIGRSLDASWLAGLVFETFN